MAKALFTSGNIYMTPGIQDLMEEGLNPSSYLIRHIHGDYGDLCLSDCDLNRQSIPLRDRIMSSYVTPYGKMWIMTEWEDPEVDKPYTTLLTPAEY